MFSLYPSPSIQRRRSFRAESSPAALPHRPEAKGYRAFEAAGGAIAEDGQPPVRRRVCSLFRMAFGFSHLLTPSGNRLLPGGASRRRFPRCSLRKGNGKPHCPSAALGGFPSPAIRPSCRTRIRLHSRMVFSLWEITTMVSDLLFSQRVPQGFLDLHIQRGSRFVQNQNVRVLQQRRAIITRCFCPPDGREPSRPAGCPAPPGAPDKIPESDPLAPRGQVLSVRPPAASLFAAEQQIIPQRLVKQQYVLPDKSEPPPVKLRRYCRTSAPLTSTRPDVGS